MAEGAVGASGGVDPDGSTVRDGRTRNRLRRREEVYAAAIELFVEQGFDHARMDDIADRAGVARATVFNHFSYKSAFLDEWSARRRRRALEAVQNVDHGGASVRVVLERYMTELADASEVSRAETVALIGSTTRSTDQQGNTLLANELADLVRRGQAVGEIRAGVSTANAGLLLAAGYFAVLEQWIREAPPFDLRATLVDLVGLVLDGIADA